MTICDTVSDVVEIKMKFPCGLLIMMMTILTMMIIMIYLERSCDLGDHPIDGGDHHVGHHLQYKILVRYSIKY